MLEVSLLLTRSYLFDEPSSYLDVKQRLKAALAIRNVIGDISNLKQKYRGNCLHDLLGSYVIVVEHDLSVLDYLSDYICVLWGLPGTRILDTTVSGTRCLWRCHYAIRCTRRDQHLSRWLYPHGEFALS